MSFTFKIGSTDFSRFVLADGSYKINKVDYYNDVVNGRRITHRIVDKRSREGSLDMLFARVEDYENFARTVEENRTIGAFVPVTAKINNTVSVETFLAFVTFEPSRERDNANRDAYGKFTVNVKEI